jgi:hypothetical protein
MKKPAPMTLGNMREIGAGTRRINAALPSVRDQLGRCEANRILGTQKRAVL